ncbi:uncharacterized protein LOC143448355 isoform X2 [Clavelina lepadiformis]|uniref:uncharacterized protein LOC143448355 isoform X2 n=1 Tax=Clavelina lepadiformis TaxID=159417 RepID=UPI00404182C7
MPNVRKGKHATQVKPTTNSSRSSEQRTEIPSAPKTKNGGMNDQIREDFHKEVNWCIEQLRMGMFTKNPSKQQVQECERVIRILTSSKAPLVKKRQAMRQMFGDYRKKIEAEERKWHEAMMKQMQALKISNVEDITGTFLKQSSMHSMSSTGSGRRNSSIDDLQEKLFEDPSEKNTDNNERNRGINRKIADERQQGQTKFLFNFDIEPE